MPANLIHIYRPPTATMIETLMDVHERELLNLPPIDAMKPMSAKGLIQRELLEVKPYVDPKGKKILCLFITSKGRDYLQQKLH